MAISFKRYVDIVSGVGAGAGVRLRDLIGRLFTTNVLVPVGSVVEMTTLEDVGVFFGYTSDEYKRATFYFGWISKNITRANKISFARWADVAVAPTIYGKSATYSLPTIAAITAGTFNLTFGATTQLVGPIDFSGAASLTAVAALVQTAIRAETGGAFTAATVVYDATRKSFNITGGVTGDAAVSITAGIVDCAAALGWLAPQTLLSPGSDAQSVTEVLTESANATNNFGSFLFTSSLDVAENTEAAAWNDAQNNMYIFCVRSLDTEAVALNAALSGYSGVAVTLAPLATEYPEMVPMIILAATAYDRKNSVQNYMFQQFTLSPSVRDTADADIYDPLRVNYYGQTQTAGQFIEFYQRGTMMGLASDATDQNTYANEIWLKDYAGAQIMGLLLSLAKVSANTTGRSQLMAVIQDAINAGLKNGTISVGKPLNIQQKLYIGQITDDPLAWHQVQNSGYWMDCVIQSYVTEDSRTEWKAVYTLIYAKDDAIRKVEGSHIMI